MFTPIQPWRCFLGAIAGNIALATIAAFIFSVAPVAASPLAQKEDKADKGVKVKGDKGAKGDKASDDHAHLAKVKDRLGAIEREVGELIEAGKKDEAEKLIQEARELKAMIEKHGSAKGPKSGDAGDGKHKKPVKSPDKPGAKGEQADKLEHLRREIEELRAAGRGEEAEKLAAKLRAHSAKPAKELLLKDKGAAGVEDRIAHMKKQAAELDEAGRKDEAEKLRSVIEKFQDFALGKKGFKADSDKPIDKKPGGGGEKSAAAGEIQELGQAIRSLREEVARLRDEIAELRRQVKGKE